MDKNGWLSGALACQRVPIRTSRKGVPSFARMASVIAHTTACGLAGAGQRLGARRTAGAPASVPGRVAMPARTTRKFSVSAVFQRRGDKAPSQDSKGALAKPGGWGLQRGLLP